jgi:hypothetical protein
VDEEAALAEFGQVHRGIGNAEGIQLAAIAVVAFEAEANMVDRLTAAVDRAAVGDRPFLATESPRGAEGALLLIPGCALLLRRRDHDGTQLFCVQFSRVWPKATIHGV